MLRSSGNIFEDVIGKETQRKSFRKTQKTKDCRKKDEDKRTFRPSFIN